jgi:hypothetical protein
MADVLSSIAMKRCGGCVKLVVAVDEVSRTTSDGGGRCRVASLMPWPPYIWSGWFQGPSGNFIGRQQISSNAARFTASPSGGRVLIHCI